MTFVVSSTCSSSVPLGFAGSGGWLIITVPANANQVTLTVTDQWKEYNRYFENRASCLGQVTIHEITLKEADCSVESNIDNSP